MRVLRRRNGREQESASPLPGTSRRPTPGWTASRGASTSPRRSVTSRRRCSTGQARSGLTWSAVTGDTPPQSSMPASSSIEKSSVRFGGACKCISGGSSDPRRRDRPEVLLGRARRCAVHRCAPLWEEVLDDHLLYMTVASVTGGDRAESHEAVDPCLADPDEDAGREGDLQAAGGLEGGEPAVGCLVGRVAVTGEPLGEGLEHHALTDRDLT